MCGVCGVYVWGAGGGGGGGSLATPTPPHTSVDALLHLQAVRSAWGGPLVAHRGGLRPESGGHVAPQNRLPASTACVPNLRVWRAQRAEEPRVWKSVVLRVCHRGSRNQGWHVYDDTAVASP